MDEHLADCDASASGVTIIMACRDLKRAESARTQLYGLLDAHIAGLPQHSPTHAYAKEFRRRVQLDIHRLDLSETRSVLQFGKEVSAKCVIQWSSHWSSLTLSL